MRMRGEARAHQWDRVRTGEAGVLALFSIFGPDIFAFMAERHRESRNCMLNYEPTWILNVTRPCTCERLEVAAKSHQAACHAHVQKASVIGSLKAGKNTYNPFSCHMNVLCAPCQASVTEERKCWDSPWTPARRFEIPSASLGRPNCVTQGIAVFPKVLAPTCMGLLLCSLGFRA